MSLNILEDLLLMRVCNNLKPHKNMDLGWTAAPARGGQAFTYHTRVLNCINVSSSLMQRTRSLEPEISRRTNYPEISSPRPIPPDGSRRLKSTCTPRDPLAFWTSDIRPTPATTSLPGAQGGWVFSQVTVTAIYYVSVQTKLPHFYRRPPHNPGLLRKSASRILDFPYMCMPCNPQIQLFGLVWMESHQNPLRLHGCIGLLIDLDLNLWMIYARQLATCQTSRGHLRIRWYGVNFSWSQGMCQLFLATGLHYDFLNFSSLTDSRGYGFIAFHPLVVWAVSPRTRIRGFDAR